MLNSFLKSVRAYIYFKHLNYSRKRFNIFYGGGENKPKIFKIQYNDKIELEFKKVNTDDGLEIYISNEFDKNKLMPETSCLSIKINKKSKEAYIEGISSENFSCFSNTYFKLKKEASFYLMMTIKMLKKYKDKFNINKITVRDNAIIKTNKGNFNLSQFKMLSEGVSWYEKFGFKVDKKYKKQHQINKDIINKLTIDDINILEILKGLPLDNYIKSVINFGKDSLNMKLTDFMKIIFVDNKNKYSEELYLLIIDKLIRILENNYNNFVRYKPINYYMKI